MADTKQIDLGVIGTLEHTIEGGLPSPLKPYAKALAAAVPALITAYSTLQSGHIGVVTVIQFIIAVLTVGGVYFVPLLKGGWVSGAKTGVAILGAVLSAGVAAFGNGGTQGWFSFGTAALAALLVEIVDNVPNAAPVVAAVQPLVDVAEAAVKTKLEGPNVQWRPPAAPSVSVPASAVSYTPVAPAPAAAAAPVVPPVVPLPTADQISPEG